MGKDKIPTPPREGVIYGEIAYWLLLVGVVIAVVGLVVYIVTPGHFDKVSLLNYLWQGYDCHTIWKELGNASQPLPWYSCWGMASQGDMLAMLGIAISCFAAVFGMWGATFHMVRSRARLYFIFALIIAIILTLSALGLVNMGD